MPLSGIQFDPLQAYGKEYKLLAVKTTIGASGAVSSVDGKGFSSGPLRGSVTKEATDGQYSFVMPGRGSVHDIYLLGAFVEENSDPLYATVIAKDLSARELTVQFWTGVDGTAANPSSGAILHVSFLVKNSNID